MSSRTHRDRGPSTAPSPSVPADFPVAGGHPEPSGGADHRRRARWAVVVLAVALVLALVAAGYLLALSRAWQERAGALESSAQELGGELGQVRSELEESEGTLALVESQLDAAQAQIHELADAVAQTGDDREVQRQVAEYQAQISSTATAVAAAMDTCITGQEELITHLEEQAKPAPSPSPSPSATPDDEESPEQAAPEEPEETDEPVEPEVDLVALRADVAGRCQRADEAHTSLQGRLGEQ